jgi:multidrug efflux pump subunit AcrA (membrane-fusion protein)
MMKEADVLARLDVAVLEAQLQEAEADKLRAETDRNVAVAVVGQRENEYDLAINLSTAKTGHSRELLRRDSDEKRFRSRDCDTLRHSLRTFFRG